MKKIISAIPVLVMLGAAAISSIPDKPELVHHTPVKTWWGYGEASDGITECYAWTVKKPGDNRINKIGEIRTVWYMN